MWKAFEDWAKEEYEAGWREGLEIGLKRAEEREEKRGYRKGQKKMGKLIVKLLADDRIADIEAAARDQQYLEMLYEEYGLT